MKTVTLAALILSGLMLFAQVVCGLWIRYSAQSGEKDGRFHMGLGLATAAVVAVTLVLSWAAIAPRQG